MQQRFVFLLIVTLWVAACGGNNSNRNNEEAAESAPLATAPPPAAEESEPAAVPPTLVPTAVSTVVRGPEIAAESADEVAQDIADVPELVWLPYSGGSYGNPVLTVQDGEIIYEEEPDAIEAFFDYDDGRIAYGTEFWYPAENGVDAVTDLWVYDYAVDSTQLWLDGNVARAAWSPTEDVLAVALHNGTSFDLALMSGPEDWVILNKDIDPFYSWSPDGNQIAFVRDGELFVTTLDGTESPSLADEMYEESSWVGDEPLWLLDYGLLAYADFPVTFVSLDGVELYEPIADNGDALDVNKRPFQMLWSDSQRQLIMQYEGMFGPSLQIFQFAEDIYTVTQVFDLGEGNELVDWYKSDESIIILKNGEPKIYSLVTQEIVP